jgi:hypothetical protein
VYPIYEKTMSLSANDIDIPENPLINETITHKELCPVYFFIYNTDNYFHFLYDSLPILYQFFEVRKLHPSLKLLMNPKHKYPFIFDCLNLLDIAENDILFAKHETEYSEIYVSNSLTHDGQSNDPPHPAIWSIYERMKNAAMKIPIKTPSKFYVSRRSWIHGDNSNIGTNYTTRRKLENEDEVVEILKKKGYEEVFCETLTMTEKIQYFTNATDIVGAIGGGMCNCVFSKPYCNVFSINSPEFATINKRFLYTMNHTKLIEYKDTWTTSNLYRRVKLKKVIGEIVEIDGETLTLNIGKNVTGWSLEDEHKKHKVNINEVIFLDNGLNSPWRFDVSNLL